MKRSPAAPETGRAVRKGTKAPVRPPRRGRAVGWVLGLFTTAFSGLHCTATVDVIGRGQQQKDESPPPALGIDSGVGMRPDAARPDASPPTEDAAMPIPELDAGPKLGPFGPPVVLQGFDGADDPSITMDGLELFFDGASGEEISFATRARVTDPWGPHQALVTPYFDGAGTTPSITPNGLELYFASNRPGGAGARDIWSMRRETRTSGWLAPKRFVTLNSENQDYAPGLSSSELELVLTRSGGEFATEELFLASRQTVTAEWGTPRLLALSEPDRKESDAVFAGDDLELWFIASTEDHGNDLFMAVRDSTDAEFGNVRPVSELNSEFDEGDPWLSRDGREILFFSKRSGETRLYRATR